MDQFLKFCLCQQLFTFKDFCMKTRLHNISKITNATNFTKAILESSHKVLLGTCNLTAPKRPIFFKGPQVLSNFLSNLCKFIFFRNLTMVSENTSKIMLIGPPIMEKQPFKKLKILLFLLPFISKTKIVYIFNFPSLKCFGNSL